MLIVLVIVGDPWDESFQVWAKEPLGTDSNRAISKHPSGSRLLIGHKKCFVLLCSIGEQFLLSFFREFVQDGYCFNHGLSGSCTKEKHAVRKLSVWCKIPIWFQNTVCPKTNDAFPKIQAWAYNRCCIGHVLRKYWRILKRYHDGWRPRKRRMVKKIHIFSVSVVIIPTRLLCQMQAKSSGAEFLSTISKFVKRMNFVIACLRPSQKMKLQ